MRPGIWKWILGQGYWDMDTSIYGRLDMDTCAWILGCACGCLDMDTWIRILGQGYSERRYSCVDVDTWVWILEYGYLDNDMDTRIWIFGGDIGIRILGKGYLDRDTYSGYLEVATRIEIFTRDAWMWMLRYGRVLGSGWLAFGLAVQCVESWM